MKTLVQSLLLVGSVLLTRSAAGQAPDQPAPKSCGTLDVEKLLAAHPEMRARVEAIEAQTQRYIKEAGSTAYRVAPGPGPVAPLLVIPVVVHVIYGAPAQNLSDAVIKNQIEELNLAFRGQLSPGPNTDPSVVPLPPAFASLVGDARVQFCLATRAPNGTPTTGITRRDNIGTQYAGAFGFGDQMKRANTGGTDAWNTAHYLNIWCCDLGSGLYGFGVFPGTATYPGEDGIAMSYLAFGRGHAALDPSYTLGRVAVHEVGHWLNLRHVWGDAGCGTDNVSDTPLQAGPNSLNPTFPRISTCSSGPNGPNGDMFMNHMDYVNDDSKLLFSAGQALRMQAIFGPGGYRESLKSSPGLVPTLGISTQGPLPAAVFCGDQTDYRFRPTSLSVGCGGGYLQWQWAATNGWTVTAPIQIYPQIIPSGTSGSTITLTGTYTNINGVSFPLNTASVTVGYNASAGTPVFTSSPAALCSGAGYAAAVAPVGGATGYTWTVPPGFTPTGQVTTTTPDLNVTLNAGVAGNFYLLTCQALSGICPASATATVPLTVNGGPQYKIVDSDPMQNYQGVVCQRNQISLYLVPVGPVVPGAVNALPSIINWSSGAQTTQQGPLPMEALYYTDDTPNFGFTVTATYTDACGNLNVPAVSYAATTAPAGSASLSNGYNCAPYQWRQAPPVGLPPSAPYPNPAAGTLHLPGYLGAVVVYNQQGKPVQTLLAPGTAAGAAVDTRAWPEGLYVVTGRDLTGGFQRHNVQIQH